MTQSPNQFFSTKKTTTYDRKYIFEGGGGLNITTIISSLSHYYGTIQKEMSSRHTIEEKNNWKKRRLNEIMKITSSDHKMD